MKATVRLRSLAAWLVLGISGGVQGAEGEVSPAVERLTERTIAREESAAATPAEKVPPHEAILAPTRDRKPEYAGKVPPPKIVERPGDAAPHPDARWIEGYWDWDNTRRDFAWVTGTWRVPPPGKFWVEGFWRRDEKGWDRVPGFWSERRAAPTAGSGAGAARDWSREGPPSDRPVETIGTAPAPDFFYVPGEYVPQGEGVVWRPGFWYRSQPGWEWYPARWARQATGWAFREGSWSRVAGTPNSPPGSRLAVPGGTIVSTPTVTGTAPNDMTGNPLTSSSAVAPSGNDSNATASASTGTTGMTNPIGSIGNGDADTGSEEGGKPTTTSRPGQVASTTSAGSATPSPAPVRYSTQPRTYYRGMPRYGLPGYLGFLGRYLPY